MKTLIKITLALLPLSGYTQAYTSFSVDIQAPDSVLRSIPKATIEDAISIHGLKKTTSSPSLTISFTAQNLVICAECVKANSDSTFYEEVLYSLKCEGKCYNTNNQLLYAGSWGTGQSKYTSSHMPTRQAAEDYWKANKETLEENFIASIINL